MKGEHRDCAGCGVTFPRPEKASDHDWARRRFCGQRCRLKAQSLGNKHYPGADANEAAELGSKGLLRALIRYGLRHDGLPGLPANDLLRLAAELGVAA